MMRSTARSPSKRAGERREGPFLGPYGHLRFIASDETSREESYRRRFRCSNKYYLRCDERGKEKKREKGRTDSEHI